MTYFKLYIKVPPNTNDAGPVLTKKMYLKVA